MRGCHKDKLLQSAGKKYGLSFVFWTFVGLFYSCQNYFTQSSETTWIDALVRIMPLWYLWGLSTPFLALLDRRLPFHYSLSKRLLSRALLGIIWTVIYVNIYLAVSSLLTGANFQVGLNAYIRFFPWNYIVCLLILGVQIAWDYAEKVRKQELEAAKLQNYLTEARLRSLQAQLKPHFLFNTLNAISAYVEKEPKMARRMIAQLGEMLRFSLEISDRQEITLAEELNFLQNYLDITQIRFEDRLKVKLDIEPQVLDGLVPSFLLQPLVENAVHHGVITRAAMGTVKVSAYQQQRSLILCVEDNGVGLPQGWNLSLHGGYGLKNTVERLEHLYESHHTFSIESKPHCGTLIQITIPLIFL